MGQKANNGGRNASLDNQKGRAAGRAQRGPATQAIRDFGSSAPEAGQNPAGGALGKQGKANRRGALPISGGKNSASVRGRGVAREIAKSAPPRRGRSQKS